MRIRPATDSESERSPRANRESTTWSHRLVEGAKGGLVATFVMTTFRLPIARSLPPTAQFWAKFVAGGDPDDHPLPALVLHLLYGTMAGAVFGGLVPRGGSHDDATHRGEARREQVGLLGGVAYGLALSIFGERVVLERVLGLDLADDERFIFHVGHLVYGLTLGTWLGSRTGDR